jgi:hypothetical protein
MPNWCDNVVTIRHDDQNKLKELHDAMVAGKFLQSVIPIPEELQNPMTSSFGGDDKQAKDELRQQMVEKYGYESWYDFCVDKWGTKWDVEIHSPILEDGQLTASFSSAWAPPVGVYQELTEKGFSVDAKYCEFGMQFAGTYDSEDGEYSYTFDDLPEDLDEEFRITESIKEWEEQAEE